jgi:hypothetical protein
MTSRKKRRRLQGFVAMPDGGRHTPRLRGLLNRIADDYKIDLIFAHERLTTHSLLIKNLQRLVARADFVVWVTDGQDLDVSFEAGCAVGLRKPFLLVILPETWRLPATFMGHFYVELSGDVSDHECLRSALASLVAEIVGKDRARPTLCPVELPRMGCAVGRSAD